MFIILTNQGGPMQWIGLALFLIQFLPAILDVLFVELQTHWKSYSFWLYGALTMVMIPCMITVLVCWATSRTRQPQPQPQPQPQQATTTTTARNWISSRAREFQSWIQTNNMGQLMAMGLGIGLFFFLLTFVLIVLLGTGEQPQQQPHHYRHQPPQQQSQQHHQQPQQQHEVPIALFWMMVQILTLILVMVVFHHMGPSINNRHQQYGNSTTYMSKLSELVQVVQKMPIEEFVPNDQLSQCSIRQLKQMLKLRQTITTTSNKKTSSANNTNTNSNNDQSTSFLERSELERAVQQCRNYNESCCICCEDYQLGDPLRIVPKCGHEFHVECLDQWAFTFANQNKRQRHPTCPLCNTTL